MSDSGSWAPPGGSEPPPPPPPPEALGQWTSIERSGGAPSGGWEPPPSPPRRTGVAIIAVVGVVLLLVGLGAIALVTVRGGAEVSDSGSDPVMTEAPRPATERDQELAGVLTTIDGAERRMISFQDRAMLALQADPEGFGDEVTAEAADAAEDLVELREDLVLHARDGDGDLEGIRAIRDTYRVHLEAWIAYTEAVRDDPVLIRPDNSDAEPYWDDIGSTAEDFVRAVRTGMPSDAPEELRERAEFILDRGFSTGEDPGELV